MDFISCLLGRLDRVGRKWDVYIALPLAQARIVSRAKVKLQMTVK